jgi:hypothetical protein
LDFRKGIYKDVHTVSERAGTIHTNVMLSRSAQKGGPERGQGRGFSGLRRDETDVRKHPALYGEGHWDDEQHEERHLCYEEHEDLVAHR